MSSDDHTQPLFNALPPVVVALALAVFAVEVLISAGARGYIGGAEAVGWRLEAIREYLSGETGLKEVRIVLFGEEALEAWRDALENI